MIMTIGTMMAVIILSSEITLLIKCVEFFYTLNFGEGGGVEGRREGNEKNENKWAGTKAPTKV